MTEDNCAEIWMRYTADDIDSTEHFEFSNEGRIRSFKTKAVGGKIIQGFKIGGFAAITLKMHEGRKKTKYVHKIIAELFLAKPDANCTFLIHRDFNKLNNHPDNLKWVNAKSCYAHRKLAPDFLSTRRANAKLSEETVACIRKELKPLNGQKAASLTQVAKKYKVSITQIRRISLKENWR